MIDFEIQQQLFLEYNFKVPYGYTTVHDWGLTRIYPWFFLSQFGVRNNFREFCETIPDNYLLPFARHSRRDTLACFDLSANQDCSGTVVIVRDDPHPGMEIIQRYDGFWQWFRFAVLEMIDSEIETEGSLSNEIR